MKMHRYFLWVFLGMILASIVIIASVEISLGSHPEDGRWVSECLKKKSAAIEKKAPELVILSGSNALFGFSARRLTEQYGIESVNAAVHAGLGLNYILSYARNYIAPGRVFVLPLEYELYSQSSSSGAFIYQVLGFDPSYFRRLNLLGKAKFISEIPWSDRARFLWRIIVPQAKNETDGYQSRTLNDWGDEAANIPSTRTPMMLARSTKQKPKQYLVNESIWEEIESFAKEVKAAGGRVVLAYPNIYVDSLDTKLNRSFFAEIAQRATKLEVSVLGTPEAATFDAGYAFDTYYHQNTAGQSKSTDRLYNDLRQAGIL